MPSVPRHYSALTSLPRRHGLPTPSPPVVRPIDRPFAFEANLHGPPLPVGSSTAHLHPNRHIRLAHPEIHAEPRSHHVPALGLGGALISLNGAQADARLQHRLERDAQMRNHTAAAAAGSGFFGRAFHRVFSFLRDNESEDMHVQDLLTDDLFDQPARAFAVREVLLHHPTRQMEYNSEFTHPGKPESGYVFDFAPPEPSSVEHKPTPIVIDLSDDETPGAGPSTKPPDSPSPKPSTLLVCARCLDPLVLGGGLVGEERHKRKVWALRCGHLIDGQCLDVVGAPKEDVDVADQETEAEREDAVIPGQRTDHRWKGKARAVEGPVTALPDDNPIRSRLRSRGSVPGPFPSVPSPAPPHVERSSPASLLGKRKRPSKTRVEPYEWRCPVTSCGHIHVSVKVDGAWVPEPARKPSSGKGKGKGRWIPETDATVTGRGAIAIFV